MSFLHCKNDLKRAQNVQKPEFAYYASKSGKSIKQTPTPPFWGDVGVKKWFLDSGTCSPIFRHLKMGTFAKRAFSTKWWPGEENAPKIIFGLLSYRYKIYQVGLEFRKLFDILVHPNQEVPLSQI